MDLSSRVEVTIGARGLPKMDRFSKSDPFAVLYLMSAGRWEEVGRTEMLTDNHNPDFTTQFHVTYMFEEVQNLKVEIYDSDKLLANGQPHQTLTSHDFVGLHEFRMGTLMGSRGTMIVEKLNNPKNQRKRCGDVVLRAEEMSGSADVLKVQFSAKKLDNKVRLVSSGVIWCHHGTSRGVLWT